MFAALDISTSALVAQRTRLDTISGNIANLATTRNEKGDVQPYQPRYVVFETDDDGGLQANGAVGVKVSAVEIDTREPLWKYQPGHPDAARSGPRKGYVAYPNINLINEFVDATEATRAYEANVGVIEASKAMGQQTLRILT
jgi:flagellar basal-body rod protein FlgC